MEIVVIHARGLRTVVGGRCKQRAAAKLKADHVVIGEAESLIGDLARELESGRPIACIKPSNGRRWRRTRCPT